jgi:hypothetical protein
VALSPGRLRWRRSRLPTEWQGDGSPSFPPPCRLCGSASSRWPTLTTWAASGVGGASAVAWGVALAGVGNRALARASADGADPRCSWSPRWHLDGGRAQSAPGSRSRWWPTRLSRCERALGPAPTQVTNPRALALRAPPSKASLHPRRRSMRCLPARGRVNAQTSDGWLSW